MSKRENTYGNHLCNVKDGFFIYLIINVIILAW